MVLDTTTHKTVHKFAATLMPVLELKMPKGARILSVQSQRGSMNLWAAVDPDAETEQRTFVWFGTGHDLLPAVEGKLLEYVTTVQENGGIYVWHLFEQVDALKGVIK